MTNLSPRRTLAVMIGLGLGMLLAALDQTIVSTAMPNVVAHLGGFEKYSWVFTAYMLTSTVTVPLYGKLSDLYGRKPFFLWGMVMFMVGSILSGLSQNMEQLIAFRALQGIGAGALMPVALAVIGDIFPPAKRGKVQGLMGTVFGISSILGPSLGGYITDNLEWRWVFYVNIPIGIAALAVVLFTMPWDRSDRATRSIDYLGAAALVAGLVPLLVAFSQAGEGHPWLSGYILSLFAVAAVFLIAFVWIESRAKEPIIPLDLFRNGIYSVSMLAVFLTAMGMFGTIMFIPLFVQGVIGTTATNSGYILTPLMLAIIVSSIGGGQLISRWGRYRVLALVGLATMAVGMLLLSRMSVDTTSTTTVRNMIITGFGLGVTMPLYVIVVQNAFPHSRMGVVTSSVQFFRSIGGTIGVAVMGSLMTQRFHSSLTAGLPQPVVDTLSPQALAALSNPQALLDPQAREAIVSRFPAGQEALAQQLLEALRSSLAESIAFVFILGLGIVVLAWAVNWFLKEIPLRTTHHTPGEPEVAAIGEQATPAGPQAGTGGRTEEGTEAPGRPLTDEA